MQVVGKGKSKSKWTLHVWTPDYPKNWNERKLFDKRKVELQFNAPVVRDKFQLWRCRSPHRGLGYAEILGTDGRVYDVPFQEINHLLDKHKGWPGLLELTISPKKSGGSIFWYLCNEFDTVDTYDMAIVDAIFGKDSL